MPRGRTGPAMEESTATPAEQETTQDSVMEQDAPQTTAGQETQDAGAPSTPAAMKIGVTITSTRNYHDKPERARATVTLNDCFVIKGFRVMKGENGLFVSMPARRGQDGQYREICHAITSDFAKNLNATVLGEYQVHLAQQMEESQAVRHVIDPNEAQSMDAAPDMEPPDQGMSMEM